MSTNMPTPGSRDLLAGTNPMRPTASVISLVDVRARRRAEAEAAALASILESARSIDIVRLFELKLEREAKQQALYT